MESSCPQSSYQQKLSHHPEDRRQAWHWRIWRIEGIGFQNKSKELMKMTFKSLWIYLSLVNLPFVIEMYWQKSNLQTLTIGNMTFDLWELSLSQGDQFTSDYNIDWCRCLWRLLIIEAKKCFHAFHVCGSLVYAYILPNSLQ